MIDPSLNKDLIRPDFDSGSELYCDWLTRRDASSLLTAAVRVAEDSALATSSQVLALFITYTTQVGSWNCHSKVGRPRMAMQLWLCQHVVEDSHGCACRLAPQTLLLI